MNNNTKIFPRKSYLFEVYVKQQFCYSIFAVHINATCPCRRLLPEIKKKRLVNKYSRAPTGEWGKVAIRSGGGEVGFALIVAKSRRLPPSEELLVAASQPS